MYAGSVHVDEPTEEFLGVTLAEQCHDGSSEHVAVSRFFLSPPRDREQRNTYVLHVPCARIALDDVQICEHALYPTHTGQQVRR